MPNTAQVPYSTQKSSVVIAHSVIPGHKWNTGKPSQDIYGALGVSIRKCHITLITPSKSWVSRDRSLWTHIQTLGHHPRTYMGHWEWLSPGLDSPSVVTSLTWFMVTIVIAQSIPMVWHPGHVRKSYFSHWDNRFQCAFHGNFQSWSLKVWPKPALGLYPGPGMGLITVPG